LTRIRKTPLAALTAKDERSLNSGGLIEIYDPTYPPK
jgi:hypothetical protein